MTWGRAVRDKHSQCASSLVRGIVSSAFAAATLLLTVVASPAADMAIKAPAPPPPAAPQWFIQGDLGVGWGFFDDLKFLNPVAVAGGVGGGLLSPTSGNYILLNNKSLNSTSFTGGAAVGYFFTNEIFGTVSYQYFGKFKASGFALFTPPFGNVRQDLETTAQGLLFGLGWDYNLSPVVFVEPTAQIGVGFLHSTGVQGANIGALAAGSNFPSQNNTNFIAGAGLGIGYHVTRTFDLLLAGNYYYLGKADTGVTGNPPPGAMNPGEQLQARLSEATLTAVGRIRF
jgi:hypothetical protein